MKNAAHIRTALLVLVMSVLLLPLAQECISLFREKKLYGFYVPAKKPALSFEGWWDGTVQDSFEVYHNEQFGLRNAFVRLHNEIEYDLFQHPNGKEIIVGKNEYLYELNYIKAYNGEDYIGEEQTRALAKKIKTLQDTLSKKNITLIIAFAPGKASYYPEYIPDELCKPSPVTNYKAFTTLFKASGINCIDFNSWFIREKEKLPCPLYPKTGIHWSRYGSVLAADSLISYIEQKRTIDMPSLITNGFTWSDSLQQPDEDIGKSMNLIFPVKPLLMAYTDYGFEYSDTKAKIKMMVIGDSFFWSLYDMRLAPRSFKSIDFWYYNREVFHSDGRQKELAENADNCFETENNNVVLIMASESNLGGLGWGYINEAYDYFVLKNSDHIKNKMILSYENKIRMDQAWMISIKSKASAEKIPLDSMIHMDAVYLYEQRQKEK